MTHNDFVLAPIEPTREMLDAGVDLALRVSVAGEGGWVKYTNALYAAMLSARPTPPDDLVEAIAREVDPEAWEEYLLEDGRVDQEVAAIFQEAYEESIVKARRILALIQKEGER